MSVLSKSSLHQVVLVRTDCETCQMKFHQCCTQRRSVPSTISICHISFIFLLVFFFTCLQSSHYLMSHTDQFHPHTFILYLLSVAWQLLDANISHSTSHPQSRVHLVQDGEKAEGRIRRSAISHHCRAEPQQRGDPWHHCHSRSCLHRYKLLWCCMKRGSVNQCICSGPSPGKVYQFSPWK